MEKEDMEMLLRMINHVIKQEKDLVEIHCSCGDGYVPDVFGNSYYRCTRCDGSLKIKVPKIEAIEKYMKILYCLPKEVEVDDKE